MRFPPVMNGSVFSDLAWSGVAPALLLPPFPREHPRAQGKPRERDARLGRSTPLGGGGAFLLDQDL